MHDLSACLDEPRPQACDLARVDAGATCCSNANALCRRNTSHLEIALPGSKHALPIGAVSPSRQAPLLAVCNTLKGSTLALQSDPPEGPHAGSLINHLHGSHDVIGPDVPEELQGRELVGTKHAAQLVAVVRSVTADQVGSSAVSSG